MIGVAFAFDFWFAIVCIVSIWIYLGVGKNVLNKKNLKFFFYSNNSHVVYFSPLLPSLFLPFIFPSFLPLPPPFLFPSSSLLLPYPFPPPFLFPPSSLPLPYPFPPPFLFLPLCCFLSPLIFLKGKFFKELSEYFDIK